jgi:CO/xanthine dehydrogenase Mo-binding subunit
VYFEGTFGAQVRRVLLDNAANKLGVPVDELTTEPSVVAHAKLTVAIGKLILSTACNSGRGIASCD